MLSLDETIKLLKVLAWPVVALIGVVVVRGSLPALLGGSKLTLSLFGQKIETSLPELEGALQEQVGGSLTDSEQAYLDEIHASGAIQYPEKPSSSQRKLIRPLRNFGLVMTVPRNAYLADAAEVQLTSLGKLYMRSRAPERRA
ncbi:MAG: hypothetical protein AAF430_22080 [Myxococcota bacterium]